MHDVIELIKALSSLIGAAALIIVPWMQIKLKRLEREKSNLEKTIASTIGANEPRAHLTHAVDLLPSDSKKRISDMVAKSGM